MIHERDRRTNTQTPHDGIGRAYASHRTAKTMLKALLAAAVGRKTILKQRLAAAANTHTSDFPDVKFRVAALIR